MSRWRPPPPRGLEKPKKSMKRFIKYLAIPVLAALALTACKDEDNYVKSTGVSIDKTSLELTVGDTYQLNATISPDNATSQAKSWYSDDSKIAEVNDNGVVTAIAPGTTKIHIKTVAFQWTASCDVVVNPVKVKGVSLNKTSIKLLLGQTETLVATLDPANATDQSITWTSSDESIAKVEGGAVTALTPGEATITVTTKDGGYTATCKVESTLEVPTEPQTLDLWKDDGEGYLGIFGGSTQQTVDFISYNGKGVVSWSKNTTGKPRTATMEFSTGSKITITQISADDFKGEWNFTAKVFAGSGAYVAASSACKVKTTFGEPRNTDELKDADGDTYKNNVGVKGLYHNAVLDCCADIDYTAKTVRFGLFLDTRDGVGQDVDGKFTTFFPGLATRTANAWASPWLYTETELGDPDYVWLWFEVTDDFNTIIYRNRNNNGIEFQTLKQYKKSSTMNQICGFGTVLSSTNVFNNSTVNSYSQFYQVNSSDGDAEFFVRVD